MVWDNFKTCDNQRQLEVRNSFFSILNNFVDDIQLLSETHFISIIIEKHATDMAQLNCEYILAQAGVYSLL